MGKRNRKIKNSHRDYSLIEKNNPGSFISSDQEFKLRVDSQASVGNTQQDLTCSAPHYLYASVKTIDELFLMQVLLHPDKVAVLSGNSSLTYRELDFRTDQIAHRIISAGLLKGSVIGICLDRSVDMVVSVLGILKAGCTYLPLDPVFPDERIRFMSEDSGARMMITQDIYKRIFSIHKGIDLHIMDSKAEETEVCLDKKDFPGNDQDSLAYIIYTSGSTGRPKGVKVHHEAVVNFLISMSKMPGFHETDRLLAVTTLSFDISVLEILLPLVCGGELYISSSYDILDGQLIIAQLEEHNITVMQGSPATWNLLLESGWKGKKNLKALCGGERLTPDLLKNLYPKVGELWNMYGPTETTVWSACHRIENADLPVLVGKPIDNTVVYIVDHNNNILPATSTGEVCIGGTGVCKGYQNLPELTNDRFIFLKNGEYVYKTGDEGRVLPDGNIELFGRLDNQIKLRGFRIEPGEIEVKLSSINGIKLSVVKVVNLGENDERLVAFIITAGDFGLSDKEISENLSLSLPSYMIPAFYIRMNKIPRLPNGKIDRSALRFENNLSSGNREEEQGKITETERRLKTIWESVLKKNIKLVTDNFFDLGGQSLLALRVVNRIREELGIMVSFNDMLCRPTIREMAMYIENNLTGSG